MRGTMWKWAGVDPAVLEGLGQRGLHASIEVDDFPLAAIGAGHEVLKLHGLGVGLADDGGSSDESFPTVIVWIYFTFKVTWVLWVRLPCVPVNVSVKVP